MDREQTMTMIVRDDADEFARAVAEAIEARSDGEMPEIHFSHSIAPGGLKSFAALVFGIPGAGEQTLRR